MAKRTINSPGVEIRERDLTLRVPTPGGTKVYLTGFADQGPIDEVVLVTSISEFESIYGQPKSPAERYFYHSVKAALNSTASVYVNRLPYGDGSGVGFGSKYGVLAYPAAAVSSGTINSLLSATTVTFAVNPALLVSALSGAAFRFQISNGQMRTVVYNINNNGAFRSGDITANISTGNNLQTVINATSAAIRAVIPTVSQLPILASGNTLSFVLSTPRQITESPSTSASVLAGLEDANDIFTVGTTLSTGASNVVFNSLDISEGTYLLGRPTQFSLNQTEYLQLLNGELFDWSSANSPTLASLSDLGKAAVLVINKGQTTIDGKYNGYYLGLADNTNINPATNYDAILSVNTATTEAPSTGLTSYTTIPSNRFNFALSATSESGNNPALNSISQVMEEKITSYDISTNAYNDTLNVGLFKIKQSVFSKEAIQLDYLLEEGYNGSIGYHRQINSQSGGAPINFFLGNVESSSRNIDILVNKYVSDELTGINLDSDGLPKKKVRLITNQLSAQLASSPSTQLGLTLSQFNTVVGQGYGLADSLYPLGVYGETNLTTKNLGLVPDKLNRALDRIKNDEIFDIDVVAEAGLGTIWTGLCSGGTGYFDDTKTLADVTALRTSNTPTNTNAITYYTDVANKFITFCSPPKDGGRGDVLFIADPLRQILVAGKDSKVVEDPTKNFSTDIYWPMRHQFSNINTSYATTYANYMKVFDDYSGLYVYVPPSGFVAAKLAASDAEGGPWLAPAGFNRGVVNQVSDIAITPNQRQRDELYKVGLNPIAKFPDQGVVVFGQKTLIKTPSAFDRVNVRRTFLYLEKITKQVMKFFLFENNNLFTRTRVVNTLVPFFERVKVGGGLFDYLIICDERNNTADVIDNNELVVDIYLKPVKTAEFILVNFYATRTDANFEELVG